jgi:pantoate--beta-alanine ligase
MGNLHAGHLALVDAAREHADRVVSSIYVNPTQFGPGEDFDRYPRTLEADCLKLEKVGCDLVFAPGEECMYPGGVEDAVQVSAPARLASLLEGARRPGHFDGVVTVVARLFNLVYPDIAVFGEKDYQQLLVIRRLVRDMGYPVRIEAVPTVREQNGLAMSSRNEYLDSGKRAEAAVLYATLEQVAREVAERPVDLDKAAGSAARGLERLGFRVDYLAIRRAQDLEIPQAADEELRILCAAWSGETRLIDNLHVKRFAIS